VQVFEHVKSGCCHIAKDSTVDEDDGEATVLRCGKIATRNFRKVEQVGNFMPYKCTRFFSAHRTVGGLGSEGDKTVLLGPKNWNPISSSKCTVLARHG